MNATFSIQQLGRHNESYEMLDVTPDVIEWAKANLEAARAAWHAAHAQEAIALRASRGERSWRRNGGHQKARTADSAAIRFQFFEVLARGSNQHGSLGWIDRRELDLMKQLVS